MQIEKETQESQESDHALDISDEYEQIDETTATPLKILVKRATRICADMTRENAEYYELMHKVKEHQSTVDELTEQH